MTTAAEILAMALKDAGVTGTGQTASADDTKDALDSLNQMLAQWQADRLYVYAQKEIVATLTGAASYTVGTGGQVNVARPVSIDMAVWRVGTTDYPVVVFQSLEDYERIMLKSSGSSLLYAVCYVPSYPLGMLYVVPSVAAGELRMVTRADLPFPLAITDSMAFPPEYTEAIRYSLVERLCTLFQTPLRPDIAALAMRARRIIKRNNTRVPIMTMPDVVLPHRTYFTRQY